MDDLDAALKNYRKTFNAKLDAYQSNVFPVVNEEVSPDTKLIKEEEPPTIKPKTEQKHEKEKKIATSANKGSEQESKSNPIKKKFNETISKTNSTQNEIEINTQNTHETIQDTATEDENTNTTTETPISTPKNDKPPIEPIIIQRHIIHRTIQSTIFRFSFCLILLLLL